MADQLNRSPSDDRIGPKGRSDGHRLLTVGSLVTILASVGGSIVGYGMLPPRIRIHWSLGGPYYGPEFAPTWIILAVFPVLVISVALGSYWIGTRVQTAAEFATVRPYYTLAVLGTLVLLMGTQAFLILANL